MSGLATIINPINPANGTTALCEVTDYLQADMVQPLTPVTSPCATEKMSGSRNHQVISH